MVKIGMQGEKTKEVQWGDNMTVGAALKAAEMDDAYNPKTMALTMNGAKVTDLNTLVPDDAVIGIAKNTSKG